MAQPHPDRAVIAAALAEATDAVVASKTTRASLGRRRTPTRAKRLTAARDRCAAAAEPIRSWLGMVAWGGIEQEDELAMKKVMTALRYERRQIDKMKLADA